MAEAAANRHQKAVMNSVLAGRVAHSDSTVGTNNAQNENGVSLGMSPLSQVSLNDSCGSRKRNIQKQPWLKHHCLLKRLPRKKPNMQPKWLHFREKIINVDGGGKGIYLGVD